MTPKEKADELDGRTLRAALSKSGHRMTAQRQAIYAAVMQCKGHPTVEEVYRKVRETYPKVSLATVYNGLEALVAAGEIGKIPRSDDVPAQYEIRTDIHNHARCVICHRVWDLDSPAQPLPIAQLIGNRNFKALGARVEVLIDCPIKTNTPLGLAPDAVCPLDLKNPSKRKPGNQGDPYAIK